MMRVGGIVVCGGRGTRMGIPKVRLPFGDESMLVRIVRRLAKAVDPIVVVSAMDESLPELPPGVQVAHDRVPDRGPLEGIAVGLRCLQPQADAAFITSCDVPGIMPEFVATMIGLLETHDIVVPRDGEFYHPLAAVYRVSVLPQVEALLAAGQLRPYFLFQQVATRELSTDTLRVVDPTLQTLQNINRPEDYRAALLRDGLPVPAWCASTRSPDEDRSANHPAAG